MQLSQIWTLSISFLKIYNALKFKNPHFDFIFINFHISRACNFEYLNFLTQLNLNTFTFSLLNEFVDLILNSYLKFQNSIGLWKLEAFENRIYKFPNIYDQVCIFWSFKSSGIFLSMIAGHPGKLFQSHYFWRVILKISLQNEHVIYFTLKMSFHF